MAIDRKQLILTFKDECMKIDPLYDGYNEELYKALTDIIFEEYNHQIKATNIQQKVNDAVDRFAKLMKMGQKL